MAPPDRLRIERPSEIVGPALLTAWFLGTGILGVSAAYRVGDLVWLTVCYASLSIALHQGALLLGRLAGRAGGWIGAFLLSLTLAWQLREQTFVPDSIGVTVVVAALATPLVFGLLAGPARAGSWRRRAVAVVAAAVTLLLGTAIGFRASETFRWHLLRHNTLLGTPAFYLLEPSVGELQAALFELHDPVPPPGGQEGRPSGQPAGPLPNLVFVLLDTLRADALAAWGGDPELMPRLNGRLAESMRFTDVWANASWTRPSMASLFTGLLPEEHGAVGVEDALAAEFTTLAEILGERGYRTVGITTNLAAAGRGAGFSQGFDTFVELAGDPYARADRVARTVDAWLAREGDEEARVFLYLHFLDPHEPYLAGDAPTRRTARAYRAGYRNELRYLDRHLDEILERVGEELPGPDVVVVASDHGEELFEHELFGHGQSLYQEVIHVPVAVGGPGIEPGSVGAPLELRDFHDLMLRLGGGGAVDPADWARREARGRRYGSLYYSTTGRLLLRPYLRRVAMRTIQEGDEKLIWSAYGDTRELYDLSSDPGETRNLLVDRPDRAAELTEALGEPVRFWVERTPIEVSEREREQLKALGYLD